MAFPGEVRTNNQELGLMLVRFLIFVGTLLLIAGVGLLLNLPAIIFGVLAGLAAFGLIVGGSLFEVVPVACPSCGHNMKVVKNIGSFRCSQCEQGMYIYGGEIERTIDA